MNGSPSPHRKGRGAQIEPDNPYSKVNFERDWADCGDDPEYLDELQRPATQYIDDESQSIVTENNSPDIGFRYSLNPYRGCAHGCSYCYARPTHEYLGWNAGLDFETRILVKRRAAELFRLFLARPQWKPEMIAFSGVTDCYQPIERELRITRACIEVAAECRQPIGIVTKNALVTRDRDLLRELADHRAVRVFLSITTLDARLARVMEPQTSSPEARLRTIGELTAAGVPTGVMVAPVIPGLNDDQMPAILKAAREAGADSAGYVVLRLPLTVRPVFLDWLQRTRPNHYKKVELFLRSMRGGQLNDSQFGRRQRGTGPIAEQIRQTFTVFKKRLGYCEALPPMNYDDFQPPRIANGQQRLF